MSGGRPTKLTAEIKESICSAIRAGNHRGIAARAAGISESTFFRWMERGRQAKTGLYREFHDAVLEAEAKSEAYAVVILRKAMPRDWRAALAFLRHRHGWNTERVSPAQERPNIDLSQLTETDLKSLERIYGRLADD